MELFSNEVKNMQELKDELKQYDVMKEVDEYEVAVIVVAFDKENKIIFQRRGPGCRDERFKLETIGGRVKQSDENFREALKREIIEECGSQAEIQLEEFIISTYAKTYDCRNNKEQNWIYLLYKGSLISGELHIAEPTKNLGYERYKINAVDENELSNGARELYSIVKRKYSNLK